MRNGHIFLQDFDSYIMRILHIYQLGSKACMYTLWDLRRRPQRAMRFSTHIPWRSLTHAHGDLRHIPHEDIRNVLKKILDTHPKNMLDSYPKKIFDKYPTKI